MLSSDYDTAIDHLMGITRGEVRPYDELIASAYTDDVEDCTTEDVLTAETEVE